MVHRPSWDVGMAEMSYSLPGSCLLTTHPHPSALRSCQFFPASFGEGDDCLYWLVDIWARDGPPFPLLPMFLFLPPSPHQHPVFYKPTGLEESILEGESRGSRAAVLGYPPFHPLPAFECPLPPPPKNSSYSLLPQNQMLSKPAWLLFKPFSERSLSGRPSAVSTQ